jgi:transposase
VEWIFSSYLGSVMNRAVLTDEQWSLILPFLMAHSRVYVGAQAACRRFLEAVLWILRSGAQWRFLPRDLGAWNTIFKRFARWCQRGVWADLQAHVAAAPDLQEVLIDSTIVRAHACAAGACGSAAEDEALGRSRGGFSTKIHALTDALGNPLKFIVRSKVETTAFRRSDLSLKPFATFGCKDGLSIRRPYGFQNPVSLCVCHEVSVPRSERRCCPQGSRAHPPDM